MSNNYFEEQNEPTPIQWPTETWFQKRRKVLARTKHLHCLQGCEPVPVKFNDTILTKEGAEGR